MKFTTWVFWFLFIGFAIKVPVFPFHTWLPDAHVEAPTADLGHPGRHPAEAGRLRHAAGLLPDRAGDRSTSSPMRWRSWG